MKKLALVFPGQGSQYVGMGSAFSNHEYFERADSVFDFSLRTLCLEGPEEKLKLTEYTQPAIVIHSLILFEKLQKYLVDKEIEINFVLGHSVGEYSALTAAGCFTLEQALKAVNTRGKSMQEATPAGVGAMYAIMRVEANLIEEACQQITSQDHFVSIANHNSPSQIVISGHAKACEQVVEKLKADGHKLRAVPLPVSAPFHSELMKPAAEKMNSFLEDIEIKTNTLPYIANINAQTYENADPKIIKDNLVEQVCAQVKWVDSINNLPNGCKLIEVGPGKVLTGLCKKIRDDISIYTLDTDQGFSDLESFLEE